MAVAAEQMLLHSQWGSMNSFLHGIGIAGKKVTRQTTKLKESHELHLLQHIETVKNEELCSVRMIDAILAEDLEQAISCAKEIDELKSMVERCDPTIDNSLMLTLAIYAYRTGIAAKNKRLLSKLHSFIFSTNILDQMIARISYNEGFNNHHSMIEDTRSRLLIILCHESLAREIWGGRTVYYDPTINTVKGWLSNPRVRKAVLMISEEGNRDPMVFQADFPDALLNNVADGEEEDPVLVGLVNAGHETSSPSLLNFASVEAIGYVLRNLVRNYGQEDVAHGLRAILRYRGRSSRKIFERKRLVCDLVACILAVCPLAGMYAVHEDVRPVLPKATSLARLTVDLELDGDDWEGLHDWLVQVSELHNDFVDSLLDGGEIDIGKMKGGKRAMGNSKEAMIRRKLGELLIEHLSYLSL